MTTLVGIIAAIYAYLVLPSSARAFWAICRQGTEMAAASPMRYTVLSLLVGFGLSSSFFASGLIIYAIYPYPLLFNLVISVLPFTAMLYLQAYHIYRMGDQGDDGWGGSDDGDDNDPDPWDGFDALREQWSRQPHRPSPRAKN